MVDQPPYLRLFPLQAMVLYPGMPLPLNIFEPRYLQLIQECTAAEEPFGVVLLKEGQEVGPNSIEPFAIGTTALIQHVASLGGEERLSVSAVGGHRFRVRGFDYNNPYLAADVEYLNDTSADLVEPSLIGHVKDDAIAFVRAVMTRRGSFVHDVELPHEAMELSFHVAQLFQGNPGIQQKLLERDTFDRLWDELNLIKTAMDQIINQGERTGPPSGPTFSAN
jgi:Lon protease-like protein